MDLIQLKSVLKSLLLPPAGLLLLAAVAVLATARLPRAGRATAIVALLACWFASTFAVADAGFRYLEAGLQPLDAARWEAERAGPRPPKAVVVIGAGARRDGVLEPFAERLLTRSLERAVGAARAARLTGLPVLAHGGLTTGLQSSEAAILRRVLAEDFAVEVRWLDERVPTGHAEIGRNAAALLARDGIDSVVLSTHAYNMRRARAALEAAGLRVVPAPHTFRAAAPARSWRKWVASADGLEATFIVAYEVFGIWSYRLPGRALVPPSPSTVR